jgi:hypothetical protein
MHGAVFGATVSQRLDKFTRRLISDDQRKLVQAWHENVR